MYDQSFHAGLTAGTGPAGGMKQGAQPAERRPALDHQRVAAAGPVEAKSVRLALPAVVGRRLRIESATARDPTIANTRGRRRRRARPPYRAATCAPSNVPPPTLTAPPGGSAADFVTMLITPLTALAPHVAPPGPRTTSMRSIWSSGMSSDSQKTPGVEPVVDRPAIDEHQQLVGEQVVEPAHRDGPLVRVDLGDLHARHQPEELGHGRHARPPDVLLSDDGDGGRHVADPLLFVRDRGDLDVHEILDRHLREVGPLRLREGGRARCDRRE